jgi:hypothetical protein
MMFFRFKAMLVAALALVGACLTAPSPGNAAPVSMGISPTGAAPGVQGELFTQAGWRGHGHYGRGHFRPGHYGRGHFRSHRAWYPRHYRRVHVRRAHYRPARFYRPVRHHRRVHVRHAGFYAPVRHYRPVRYHRPVRCHVVYQTVWNGWGHVWAPVRVCRRW